MKMKKIVMWILLTTFCESALGEDKALCEGLKAKRKSAAEAFIRNENNERLDGYGSDLLQKCVKISGGNMRHLYGQYKKEMNWDIVINASEECVNVDPLCTDGGVSNTNSNKMNACEALKQTAATCDGAAFLINEYERDWNSSEHVRPPEVKGGNPEIKCKAMGIATVDYEGCAKFVQNGDIMDAAQGAIQTGQDLYYKDKATTAQMEAANSPESATASLQALHTGVKGQQDIMTQRAALDAGKFAALASYYASIPSYDDLKDKCASYKPGNNGLINNKINGCTEAVHRQHEFGFLMNQQAKEKMKAKLAQVGINVASDAVMAGLMAKRAADISNAIAKVKEFKPIDPLAPATDNLQTTYCQQNPGDSKCLTGGLERTFDAMGDNVITFGEGGTGTVYTKNPNLDNSNTGTTNAVDPTAANTTPGVGSVVTPVDQKGGLADAAKAATVAPGTAPTGSGGSGGSGGGVGGGGGGAPAGPQAGGSSSAIPGKAPTYGGGAGTLSMMGGNGINKGKSTAKDDSNPFGKLFNKDGNKSGAIDFGRSPASQKVGNKGDNLFEMISKRYTNVNIEKRLIEYEMTK